MKIERQLSGPLAAAVKRAIVQLQELDAQRLIALGRAREAELTIDSLRRSLNEQLAMFQETEGLPAPVEPYRLNAEGTALVGEIADSPVQQEAR